MPEKDTEVDVKRDNAATAPTRSEGWPPMMTLRQEIDRLFDEFGMGFWRHPMGRRLPDLIPATRGSTLRPATEMVECDGEYCLTAELPGMEAGDIEIKLTDGMFTIRGMKSEEQREEKADYLVSERRYGEFSRTIPLPPGVDAGKVSATFANGVLTVTLPKSDDARSKERRIEVNAA